MKEIIKSILKDIQHYVSIGEIEKAKMLVETLKLIVEE